MTDGLPDLDDYEFFEQLGEGTLGVVYRARDRRTNELVALKWCSADKCNLYDAALDAVFDPEWFVPVVTAGVSDDFVYIASEYQDAGSLAARLNDFGPLSAESAAKLVRTLCRAVEQLHSAGLVHGRLKPTDVLFSDNDRPRLSDLKLVASQIDEIDPFRPPEREATVAGDIYRLGGILYAALTAQAPLRFEGSIQNEPIAPRKLSRDVPHALQDICLKCLSRTPGVRYATVTQLAEDLDRFLAHRPLQGIEDEDALSPWQWLARYPLLSMAPLAAVAFGLFPLPVAAGLMAAILGVFVTPVRAWSGPTVGVVYGALLLSAFLFGAHLLPVPQRWSLPNEDRGGLLPWLQQSVNILRSPAVHAAGYLFVGGLTGWAWQSLRRLDQRQRTWTAWPYVFVLIATPWLLALEDVVIAGNRIWAFNIAAVVLSVMAIPFGMALAQLAWMMTARQTTLDNARLAAILSLILAAFAYTAAPVRTWFDFSSHGGRRALTAAAILPQIESFGTTPLASVLNATITHLSLLAILSFAGVVLLTAGATYPKPVGIAGFVLGLGVLVGNTVRTVLREPDLISLPGDSSTPYFFGALVLVIVISLIAQDRRSRRGRTVAPPTIPGFSGRLLIAAFVIAFLGFFLAVGLNIAPM